MAVITVSPNESTKSFVIFDLSLDPGRCRLYRLFQEHKPAGTRGRCPYGAQIHRRPAEAVYVP